MSEGRNDRVLGALVDAAGDELLDVHVDADHHRSVFTLTGEQAPRRITEVAVALIDLRRHHGVHPRLGAVDVVPFVPLAGATIDDAIAARDRFVAWSPVPCVVYGPGGSTLPELRRGARHRVLGHPTAGAIAVGARPVLVAYNVLLATGDLAAARRIAREVRSPAVRALGFATGAGAQVSMNLVDPATTGVAEAYDAVAARVEVAGAELVGLVPRWVLDAVPPQRWAGLGLSEDSTIERRIAR